MMGREDKATAMKSMAEALGVPLLEMAFMGDDLVDLPAMALVGLGMTVADAHPLVRQRAGWTSAYPGGGGAVREACDALLSLEHEFEPFVDAYLEGLSGENAPTPSQS
jgi:3-deoxy-D-manno-octulosonate 8-phosphate phosphatase (KDO 8-P phosphatase)